VYRRYLRARRFVPQEAYKQFKDTEDWRKDNKLDQIFETIDVEEFEQTRRLVCCCAYS
jgi:pterin-4a-carbinolamine dehydratase